VAQAVNLAYAQQLNAAVTSDTSARQSGSTSGRKHVRMTEDDVQWLKDNSYQYTVQQIHEIRGLAIDAVRKRIRSLGLTVKSLRNY
jgi:hypothetical protein